MEGKAIPYTIYLYSTLYLKMSSLSITEQALAVLKAEAAARLVAEQAAQAAAAEDHQALLRAYRLEAELAARGERLDALEQAAIATEVERLRARSPLEILQDEMAEMKRQMAAAARPPEPEALHLRERVIQLDTLYKSSLEEMAAMREEIKQLKKQADKLLSGQFILRHVEGHDPHSPAVDPRYRGLNLFTIERV